MKRNPRRRQFIILEKEVNDLLTAEPVDNDALLAGFRTFCDSYTPLMELDEKAFDQLAKDKASDEEVDQLLAETRDFKKRVEYLRAKVDKLLIAKPGSANNHEDETTSVTSLETRRRFKLPQVEIKKFSGDLMDWIGWWAQFKKIDEEPTLHESDKFQYLIQALQPGTEPHQIVSGYPQSGENYPKAIEALQKRYGEEDLLLQVYVRELLGLVISNVQTKDKVPFKDLYLKLDSHLRALKSLNLEKADPATWLFPLVESSLPEDTLYNWQRNPMSRYDGSKEIPPRSRLDMLMCFMEEEVQIRQRIEITKNFTEGRNAAAGTHKHGDKGKQAVKRGLATVSNFHVGNSNKCIFCGKTHRNEECWKADKMPPRLKKEILQKKGFCFNCCQPHLARDCKTEGLNCKYCGGKHVSVLCFKTKRPNAGSESNSQPLPKRSRDNETTPAVTMGMTNQTGQGVVFLQTLRVKVVSQTKEKLVRAFLDPGSHRSYLLTKTAEELELIPEKEETVIHSLFGGGQTGAVGHKLYSIDLVGINSQHPIHAIVRDQEQICGYLTRLSKLNSRICRELAEKNVEISDAGSGSPPVELLLGADICGQIFTGNRIKLESGPSAIETELGWTLLGEAGNTDGSNFAQLYLNMSILDKTLPNLWNLDVLGIMDSPYKASLEEAENEIKAKFLSSMTRGDDGRYTVMLPWKEGRNFLPTNKEVSLKRLENASKN